MGIDVLDSLLTSLRVSVVATLVCVAVGLPAALLLARPGWRWRRWLDVAVNLPLALPPTVLGYYLLLLIGREGPIGVVWRELGGGSLVFTPTAAVLAAAAVGLPLFVQAARNSLEEVPGDVVEAAAIDGCNRWKTFLYVLLPYAWPGLWTGVLLAYTRTLGEFGATLMVAGNIPGHTQTMSLAIYSAVQAGQARTADLLALMLTAVAAITIWTALRFRSAVGGRRAGEAR